MKRQALPRQPESVVALPGSDVSFRAPSAVKDPHWPYAEDLAESSGMMERLLRKCRVQNQLVRECLAECLGVYILIVSFDLRTVCVFRFALCFVNWFKVGVWD
jgi:hypothetical protein